jgi:hypothetical protein
MLLQYNLKKFETKVLDPGHSNVQVLHKMKSIDKDMNVEVKQTRKLI